MSFRDPLNNYALFSHITIRIIDIWYRAISDLDPGIFRSALYHKYYIMFRFDYMLYIYIYIYVPLYTMCDPYESVRFRKYLSIRSLEVGLIIWYMICIIIFFSRSPVFELKIGRYLFALPPGDYYSYLTTTTFSKKTRRRNNNDHHVKT